MNKKLATILLALIINFCTNYKSLAQELTTESIYPDYACTYTGKDRCEGFNRKLFVFNLKLNKYILRPLNIAWASVVPKYGIERLQNMYTNINYPVRLVSCSLQKDFKAARQETARFFINTTIGVAGLYDPAKDKFKIEPKQEDMGQVLAHYKVKQGPYLVLPVVRGNIRDLAGQLLDYPFRPFSYIPIAGGIANAVFSVNNTTNSQPIIKKIDESYADPYQIARQFDGISRYIKNENLDRSEVFNTKIIEQNIVRINTTPISYIQGIKSDIDLKDYNPQSPLIDSMRTSMFKDPDENKSKWSKMSVWNKDFDKKIKAESIVIYPKRADYKYRYILQKTKTSPIAFIYPSIGEGINSDHSNVLAKILYEEGYSVIIQGSAFQWEFIKSMPKGYKPGIPSTDANHLRLVSSKIINNIEKNKNIKFTNRIIVGTSFGALTGLFTVAQDQENILNISKCISVNPPIELFYALRQMDKKCMDWKSEPTDIKIRAAVAAEKVVNVYKELSEEKPSVKPSRKHTINNEKPVSNIVKELPFTEDEAQLIIGFIMRQKLSDTIFSIEECTRGKKTNVYDSINKMSFYDYTQHYLFTDPNTSIEEAEYQASLHSIEPFLAQREKYKIYHTLDDFFVNQSQLKWLKELGGNKVLLYDHGSHLGFLYRSEFLDDFKQEIKMAKSQEQKGL